MYFLPFCTIVNPFIIYCYVGRYEICSILLSTGRCEVNRGNSDGETALHKAALADPSQQSDLRTLNVLLQHAANPNLQDFEGLTALHWAVSMDRETMTSMLCLAGASPFVADSLGDTPLHKACLFGNLSCARVLMHHTVIAPHADSRVTFVISCLLSCLN